MTPPAVRASARRSLTRPFPMTSRFLRTSLACLALVAGHAGAAPYTFSGPAYQQLQRLDTYETVCQTGDPQPCDVPAGRYTLLNFGTNPATRTIVTVGESGGGGTGGTGGALRAFDGPTVSTLGQARSACPSAAVATGGTCSVVTPGRDVFAFPPLQQGFEGQTFVCSADESDGSRLVIATARCLSR